MRIGLGLDMTARGGAGGGGVSANAVFLASFDGANNDTSYTEESTNAESATFFGSAVLSSSFKKFGATSGSTGNLGNRIEFPNNATLTSGAITIEFWKKKNFAASTSQKTLLNFGTSGGNALRIYESTTNGISVLIDNLTGSLTSGALTTGELNDTTNFAHWYFEIDFDNLTVQAWRDGLLKIDSTIPSAPANAHTTMSIGQTVSGSTSSNSEPGYTDDMRIADALLGFGGTVPTEALTDDFSEARS